MRNLIILLILLSQESLLYSASREEGNSTLFLAVNSRYDLKRETIFKKALALGCDINAKNDEGMTALHIACINRDRFLLKALLDAGADMSIENNDGHTALYLAYNYYLRYPLRDTVRVLESWFIRVEQAERRNREQSRFLMLMHNRIGFGQGSLEFQKNILPHLTIQPQNSDLLPRRNRFCCIVM